MAFVYPVAATGRTPRGRTLTPSVEASHLVATIEDDDEHLAIELAPTHQS
jgi:hypothetical protein